MRSASGRSLSPAIRDLPQPLGRVVRTVGMIMITIGFSGTFMDLVPMLRICTPIFLPIITKFGIDPVHFGIVMILNLGIRLRPDAQRAAIARSRPGAILLESLA